MATAIRKPKPSPYQIITNKVVKKIRCPSEHLILSLEFSLNGLPFYPVNLANLLVREQSINNVNFDLTKST
jgi:hypothetical protein